MKKPPVLYTSWESTPLKWHKSMLAVSLFRAIYSFGSLVYLFTDLSGDVYSSILSAGGGWAYLLDISSSVVFGLTALISFIGLRRPEWTGVTVMLSWNALQAAFGVVGLALVGRYDQLLTTMFGASFSLNSSVGEFIMDNVTSLVTGVILFFANRIYYKKRRLLFSPPPSSSPYRASAPAVIGPPQPGMASEASSVDLLAQLRDECEAEQAAKQQAKLPDPKSPDRSPTALKLLCGGLACACVVLLLCCVHQAGNTERLESELAQASRDATYFEGRTRYLEKEVSFWESSAVIVLEDDYYYHTYGCPKLKNPGKYYYIYDAVDTLYYGFEPCSECDP